MPPLTTAEAAKVLGVAPATLRSWRNRGRGPRYRIEEVSGWALYERPDLEAWIEKETSDNA
jgi:DNA-binding transcriptional MerR regulator